MNCGSLTTSDPTSSFVDESNLDLGRTLRSCTGLDVTHKSNRSKDDILIVLPTYFALSSDFPKNKVIGYIELDGVNPELILEFDGFKLNFKGSVHFPQTSMFSLNFLPKKTQCLCSDSFCKILVFDQKPTLECSSKSSQSFDSNDLSNNKWLMKFGMSSAMDSLPAASSNKTSRSPNKIENNGKYAEENREDFSSEDECDTSSIDSVSSTDDNSDRSKCLAKRRTEIVSGSSTPSKKSPNRGNSNSNGNVKAVGRQKKCSSSQVEKKACSLSGSGSGSDSGSDSGSGSGSDSEPDFSDIKEKRSASCRSKRISRVAISSNFGDSSDSNSLDESSGTESIWESSDDETRIKKSPLKKTPLKKAPSKATGTTKRTPKKARPSLMEKANIANDANDTVVKKSKQTIQKPKTKASSGSILKKRLSAASPSTRRVKRKLIESEESDINDSSNSSSSSCDDNSDDDGDHESDEDYDD